MTKKTTPRTSPEIYILREITGYCYARNGNVGNPTPKIEWSLYVDGRLADFGPTKATMVSVARTYYGATGTVPVRQGKHAIHPYTGLRENGRVR